MVTTSLNTHVGPSHKDSLYSTLHLASLWKMRGGRDIKSKEKDGDAAQRLLEEALALAQETYSDA